MNVISSIIRIGILLVVMEGVCAAQTVYELRKLTHDDWLGMSTDEHMRALNTANNHAANQSFLGDFNRADDLYTKWGTDYYDMYDRYENYSFRRFERYGILENRRRRWSYNEFGDRLYKMSHVGRIWYDRINDDGTTAVMGPRGYVNYYPAVTNFLEAEGAWVIRESSGDWAMSLVAADKLRTILTPLTVSMAAMKGMKVDFHSPNYEVSIINSVSRGVIRGAQFRRKFGALDLGATWAAQYFHQTNREGGDTWRGTVNESQTTPMIFLVRVLDDSPWEGDGPVVYGVRLRVNGRYRDDIQPQVIRDDLNWERNSAVDPVKPAGQEAGPFYLLGNKTFFNHFLERVCGQNMPKYVDYLFLNDYMRGWNGKNVDHYYHPDIARGYYSYVEPGSGPIRVNGTEYVLYWFDLTTIRETVNRVQAEVMVANDYRIEAAEIYTEDPKGGHDKLGDNLSHYESTIWRTMAQADGNIKDESNLRTVNIDFGYEVGNTIYGFDAKYDYYGYKLKGEYVTNTHHYMFSDGVPGRGIPLVGMPTEITRRTGHRYTLTDHAWYVTARKAWSKIEAAGEVFKMGKFYRPYFNSYKPGYFISKYTMIDDNDDYDQFPDIGASDYDGVYPGQDVDKDGIPDTEKNRNGIPDAYEPFLMFDSDPQEFAFGDDFNNNTIPDFREDDLKFDTPYDLDRAGRHFYLRFMPQENLSFIVGSLRSRGVGVDNRTDSDYAKLRADYNVFDLGKLFAEYRYEAIQDNIHNPYGDHRHEREYSQETFRMEWDYKLGRNPDLLEYRNSKVNRLFMEARIRATPSITVENYVKYERNRQVGGRMYDNTYQLPGTLNTLALVGKIAYARSWGNWTFSPGLKYRLFKKDQSYHVNPEDYYTMRIPVVFVKYRVSPDTRISLGMQGMKGYEFNYTDELDPRNNYHQQNLVAQVENRTIYFGFTVWGAWGFKRQQVTYDSPERAYESYKSTSFFVTMYLGYE